MTFPQVPLGKLLREPLRNGKSARTSENGEGVRVFTLTAVTQGDFSSYNTKVSVLTPEEVAGVWAEPDDIFIQRSNTPDLVGTAALYTGPRNFAAFPDLLIRIRPTQQILPKFLALYLQSESARRYFRGVARGIAGSMPKIGQEMIESLLVPVPPVEIQRQIVSGLETHFSRLEDAVASLNRAKANVKRARASVLKAAVEGRLVPTEAALARAEGRDYEPASTLLARILTERRARWAESGARVKYKEPVEPKVENSNLPEGWTWASIEQLATLRGGVPIEQGWSPKCDDESAKEDEWAVITTTAIQARSFVPEAHKRLPDDLSPKPDLQVEPGDILITRAGPRKRAGVSCLVRRTRARLILCDKAYRFRVGPHVAPAYVEVALNSHEILEAIEAMKSGISDSGVNLTQKAFLALMVPLPPLAEQRRIVAEVDRRLSVLDALDATLDANLARCAKLRQSILKRAFEGKLVRPDAPVPAAPQLPLFTEEAAP